MASAQDYFKVSCFILVAVRSDSFGRRLDQDLVELSYRVLRIFQKSRQVCKSTIISYLGQLTILEYILHHKIFQLDSILLFYGHKRHKYQIYTS